MSGWAEKYPARVGVVTLRVILPRNARGLFDMHYILIIGFTPIYADMMLQE